MVRFLLLLLPCSTLPCSTLVGCSRDEPDFGRWHDARPPRASALDAEQQAMIEQLEAIGYLDGSRAPAGERTISVYDEDRVAPGLNFYTSGHEPGAILMDMRGNPLHRWHKTFFEIWPDADIDRKHDGVHSWRRAYLFPNGDVLAIFEGLALFKIDKDSRLLWGVRNGAHHDLEVLPDGRIYVLTREAHVVPWVNEREPVLEDSISILGPDGEEQRRISLLAAFENSEYRDFWRAHAETSGDIFHTNTLSLLDGTGADRNPAFRAGNVLVSMRDLDAIAVVDLEAEEIVWALRGEFRQQHDPRVLADGNLMLFDNQSREEASSVLELDIADGSVEWSYRGSEDEPFYSFSCGSARRLAGGNTLVTESDGGRAFELAPDGSIVWEFNSPHRAGSQKQFVATLYDVVRLPADFATGWLGAYAVAD